MEELGKLKELLDEGFRPAMVLRKVSRDEAERRGLPASYGSDAARALPLAHPDGRRLMFYMLDERTVAYCQGLVEDLRQVTGYSLCLYCAATGLDAAMGKRIYLSDFVKTVREDLGWDARESEYPNVFEVRFEIDGDDRSEVQRRIDDVKKLALASALKNRVGFVIASVSLGEKYKGQPFAFRIGLVERHIDAPTAEELARADALWHDDACRQAAVALQSIYAQVTDHTVLMAAWLRFCVPPRGPCCQAVGARWARARSSQVGRSL